MVRFSSAKMSLLSAVSYLDSTSSFQNAWYPSDPKITAKSSPFVSQTFIFILPFGLPIGALIPITDHLKSQEEISQVHDFVATLTAVFPQKSEETNSASSYPYIMNYSDLHAVATNAPLNQLEVVNGQRHL